MTEIAPTDMEENSSIVALTPNTIKTLLQDFDNLPSNSKTALEHDIPKAIVFMLEEFHDSRVQTCGLSLACRAAYVSRVLRKALVQAGVVKGAQRKLHATDPSLLLRATYVIAELGKHDLETAQPVVFALCRAHDRALIEGGEGSEAVNLSQDQLVICIRNQIEFWLSLEGVVPLLLDDESFSSKLGDVLEPWHVSYPAFQSSMTLLTHIATSKESLSEEQAGRLDVLEHRFWSILPRVFRDRVLTSKRELAVTAIRPIMNHNPDLLRESFATNGVVQSILGFLSELQEGESDLDLAQTLVSIIDKADEKEKQVLIDYDCVETLCLMLSHPKLVVPALEGLKILLEWAPEETDAKMDDEDIARVEALQEHSSEQVYKLSHDIMLALNASLDKVDAIVPLATEETFVFGSRMESPPEFDFSTVDEEPVNKEQDLD